MKILIQGAKILDKNSPFHKKVANVLINDGKIVEVGTKNNKADQVIDGKGKFLSIGWFDMKVTSGDPGFEHKEDLSTIAEAALAGGFTAAAILPNNKPVTQSKNDISYIKSKSQKGVDFYPIGAVTLETKGEDLTEMIDLHEAGAVAFSDGRQPIWHSDILLKSLQYIQKFNGLLINRPEDLHLNMFGVMNEGISSTTLGMKGMPKLAEEIAIQRDLTILDYTGGRLHFSNVSSERAISLIKNAKKQGLAVSCDIASYQTSFTDDDLHDFDTNLKVNPPFRGKKDNSTLLKALKDGTIDVIVSGHVPHDEESKKLEFDLADFGVISLQTVAHDLCKMSATVDLEVLLEKVTTAPRQLMGIEIPKIEKGQKANLTLLDPKAKWKFDSRTNKSKSKNSPYWEKELTGKVVAVVSGKEVYVSG